MKRVREMARVARDKKFDMEYCLNTLKDVMAGNVCSMFEEDFENCDVTTDCVINEDDYVLIVCKIEGATFKVPLKVTIDDTGYVLEDMPLSGRQHKFDSFECHERAQNSDEAMRKFFFDDCVEFADDVYGYFYQAAENVLNSSAEDPVVESIKRSRKASKKVQEMARVNRSSMVNVKNLIQHFKDICDDSFSFKCQANNTVQGARFELTHPDTDAHIVIMLTFDPDTKEYSLDDTNEEFDEFTGSLKKGFDGYDADVEDLLNDISYAEMCKDPEYRKEMGLDESKKNKKKSLKERHVGENANQFEEPNEAFDTWFSFCDSWMIESMIDGDDEDYDYENDPEDLIYPQVAEKDGIKIFFNAMFNENEDGVEYYICVKDEEGKLLDEYTSEYGSAEELEGDLRRIEHDYIEE